MQHIRRSLLLIIFIIVPAATPLGLHEALFDSLNFEYARELHLSLDTATSPIEIDYRLRWGYQGAGDPTTPFSGINGHLKINFNYDGLSFQLRKSQSLAPAVQSLLSPIETVTPSQEFYFKLIQLAWFTGQQSVPNRAHIQQSLATLIARLKLTPECSGCTLYTLPVLDRPGVLGLETYFAHDPEECTTQFINISHKGASLLALLTGHIGSSERDAYLKALLTQVNYYDKTCIITFPDSHILVIPFDAPGGGLLDMPFKPLTLTLLVPAHTPGSEATEWKITLSPDHAAMLRCITLWIHHRREPLSPHQLTEELATLCSRLSITPSGDGVTTVRAILALVCHYYQSVIHYSFDVPLSSSLNAPEFFLQLCRIAYHVSLMHPASAQEKSDFATKHVAEALRWYEGAQGLAALLKNKAQIDSLQRHGVTINWDLFIQTLVTRPTT